MVISNAREKFPFGVYMSYEEEAKCYEKKRKSFLKYDSGSEKRGCERERKLEDESVEDVDSISISICKYYSCQKKKDNVCKEKDP